MGFCCYYGLLWKIFDSYFTNLQPPLKYWVIWERFPILKSTQQLPPISPLLVQHPARKADATSRVPPPAYEKWIPITKPSEQEGLNTVDRRNLAPSHQLINIQIKGNAEFSSINGNMTVQRTHSKYPKYQA